MNFFKTSLIVHFQAQHWAIVWAPFSTLLFHTYLFYRQLAIWRAPRTNMTHHLWLIIYDSLFLNHRIWVRNMTYLYDIRNNLESGSSIKSYFFVVHGFRPNRNCEIKFSIRTRIKFFFFQTFFSVQNRYFYRPEMTIWPNWPLLGSKMNDNMVVQITI